MECEFVQSVDNSGQEPEICTCGQQAQKRLVGRMAPIAHMKHFEKGQVTRRQPGSHTGSPAATPAAQQAAQQAGRQLVQGSDAGNPVRVGSLIEKKFVTTAARPRVSQPSSDG